MFVLVVHWTARCDRYRVWRKLGMRRADRAGGGMLCEAYRCGAKQVLTGRLLGFRGVDVASHRRMITERGWQSHGGLPVLTE